MAWIEDFVLTCPGCGRAEVFEWLSGVPLSPEGRATSKGDVSVRNARGWRTEKTDEEHIVLCPDCGAEVKRKSRTPHG